MILMIKKNATNNNFFTQTIKFKDFDKQLTSNKLLSENLKKQLLDYLKLIPFNECKMYEFNTKWN